ncbi:SDR family NAD(P)-dependent oxidoreductase [Rhodococcus sp. H29-C3]|uniref:SDR family NAD(P)-dependent oxidoreductase n=1 Tax=Rhodococcus sp. H29-C3 TaxID=3046307 RepID=UPI0024B9CA46|nr:SDR family NAD(P)-dependent oxidoreductase [Rhodococcus sp. H29-C3]MDJ0359770.1 SDR family NAD(P)-dependent oxidoreductase [Rhodococcus sp. H29-C3]
MDISQGSAVVTGGASGLGLATVAEFVKRGVPTVIIDLPTSAGAQVAAEFGELVSFSPSDVTDPVGVDAALDVAESKGPIRATVHCAGRGATVRVVDRDGNPGSLEDYEAVVRTNLIGSFNVLRLAAARMVFNESEEGERGVIIMTASVAAWEGQIGQIPYAASKAGVVGMTIVAARDLARKQVRVNSIAPGIFDTPILARHSQEIRDGLAAQVPHPSRMGRASEFAQLALHIVDNAMLNGETIRIDGAIRMAAR